MHGSGLPRWRRSHASLTLTLALAKFACNANANASVSFFFLLLTFAFAISFACRITNETFLILSWGLHIRRKYSRGRHSGYFFFRSHFAQAQKIFPKGVHVAIAGRFGTLVAFLNVIISHLFVAVLRET